ncbi:glutamate dehydrogenase/leucine dehydrogenase [Bacillus tianshenii]|uniref:Glutamate dehydrogenase/leucine dehydrogenase n=1 Tax=Sutcliffiella tianshenii TaxID=1463404 RepID=A0ABS2P3K5_9BACI|nr:hypothetical protein [Bacillus tianshenii]MBM7621541.1 glutamate dehydrogenase/leucine dehydrogenase [Bacillus tianshenii]
MRHTDAKPKHVHFLLDRIEITSIMNSSGVFTGHNVQSNWSTSQKVNMGFGMVVGVDNHSSSNMNIVYDPDLVDMPIQIKQGS